jgi:hypothetical protein
MSQPPPWDNGQQSHPGQGQPEGQPSDLGQPSPWPSGNQPPAWPSGGVAQGQPPSWPSGNQPPSWPTGDQPPSWPTPDPPPPPPPPPPSWPPGGQPPYPGPGYTYGQRPPRFRRRRPRFIGAIILLGLIIGLGVVVGKISRSHEADSVSVTPFSSDTSASAGQLEPPGKIGSSFDLKDGSGSLYQVTLATVIDPATGENQFTVPEGGKRFVGLVFKVKALTGSPQTEDANNDAVVIGGDAQTYSADFGGIAGHTNFDHGMIRVAQGETVTGSVTFQVPNGVTVSKVKWTALSGYGSTAEWIVHG